LHSTAMELYDGERLAARGGLCNAMNPLLTEKLGAHGAAVQC